MQYCDSQAFVSAYLVLRNRFAFAGFLRGNAFCGVWKCKYSTSRARCAMSGAGCGNGTFALDFSNLFNFFNFPMRETLIIKCEKSEMLSEIFSNFAFGKSRIRASVPETVA